MLEHRHCNRHAHHPSLTMTGNGSHSAGQGAGGIRPVQGSLSEPWTPPTIAGPLHSRPGPGRRRRDGRPDHPPKGAWRGRPADAEPEARERRDAYAARTTAASTRTKRSGRTYVLMMMMMMMMIGYTCSSPRGARAVRRAVLAGRNGRERPAGWRTKLRAGAIRYWRCNTTQSHRHSTV
jgi:hypothetical protein